MIVQVTAHGLQGPVAEHEVAGDLRAAQVEVTVLQAQGVGDLDVLVQGKGRSLAGIEDAQFLHQHLDLAGLQLGVFHVRGAAGDRAAHGDDPFAAQLVGLGMHRLVDLRVEDHLGDAPAVAQVDEDNPAMVAAAEHPAHEDGFPVEKIRAEIVAGVCAPQRPH